jgi:hypothetical protein
MKQKHRRVMWPNHSRSQLRQLIQRFEAKAEVLALEHLLEISKEQPDFSNLERLQIAIEALYFEIDGLERALDE